MLASPTDEEDYVDWHDAPSDYYIDSTYYLHGKAIENPRIAADLDSDLAARLALEQSFGEASDEDTHRFFSYSFMALTPPSRTEDISKFLNSGDDWILQRAADLLGSCKVETAIPQLLQVIKSSRGNGMTSAVSALGRIGTEASIRALAAIYGTIESGYDGHVQWVLSRAGYEIRRNGDLVEYRRTGAARWNEIVQE